PFTDSRGLLAIRSSPRRLACRRYTLNGLAALTAADLARVLNPVIQLFPQRCRIVFRQIDLVGHAVETELYRLICRRFLVDIVDKCDGDLLCHVLETLSIKKCAFPPRDETTIP